MSGLKTFLERLNPLYERENKFKDARRRNRTKEQLRRGAEHAGGNDCFECVKSAGVVRGVGANEIGEIENYPEVCGRRMNSERTHRRNGNHLEMYR